MSITAQRFLATKAKTKGKKKGSKCFFLPFFKIPDVLVSSWQSGIFVLLAWKASLRRA